jgi:hypothetical protein
MHSVELMHLLPQGKFIRIEESDISPFFIPKPGMMQRMPRSEYDLAIDLNLDFVLPSGYICRESKAKIRIGFASDRSELFYNFVLRLPPVGGRHQIYERLTACLAMF